ncbi:hypothetical protein RSAG8_13046, partial [Rhizoctonia solani AG-8 WAC10335]
MAKDGIFRGAPMTARGAMRGTDITCKYSTAIDSGTLGVSHVHEYIRIAPEVESFSARQRWSKRTVLIA